MSTGEIILILFVYLLFFGAKGIPSLAQTMGKAIYQFRNAAKDVQDEIMKGAQDINKEMRVPLDQVDIESKPSSAPYSRTVQTTGEGPKQETSANSTQDDHTSSDISKGE
jgi:sec-independent protein translocase protein TatA